MSMSRRDRLMATIRGESVDRPPVCFYEINGLTENPNDPDPFNIFSDPSWKPLLELARDRTDRIVLSYVPFSEEPPSLLQELTKDKDWIDENGSRHIVTTLEFGGKTLSRRQRIDPGVKTTWVTEHLLKSVDDLKLYLQIPRPEQPTAAPDPSRLLQQEAALGDTGIVAIDSLDPLCMIAPLFSMEEFTIIALTEQELFTKALDQAAAWLLPRVEAIAKAAPGRLWRIYGPEYASPPYLPPRLFREYVTPYITEMVTSIHRYGGFARVHSHGRLKDILPAICDTGAMGLDPIEPPHQGDVTMAYVRENYGDQLVLFGNLEIADIENLPTPQFREKIKTALREGTAGTGRGMVLMPSACPYGRTITDLTLRNYQAMVELTENWV